MEFDIKTYPEGYERVKKEILTFLPDDEALKEQYIRSLILWFIQW